jgi:hypothetical protein
MQQMPSSILWALALTGAAMLAVALWQERRHWLKSLGRRRGSAARGRA